MFLRESIIKRVKINPPEGEAFMDAQTLFRQGITAIREQKDLA
jgi:hypothetical protein